MRAAGGASDGEPTTAKDVALAVALALVAALGYALLLQERFFGDGPGLVDFAATGGGRAYNHVLYLPLGRALAALVARSVEGPEGVVLAMKLASALPAALAVGATYLLVRGFAAGRLQAVFATALVALAPAWLFFATLVEVHALHACAVAVGAAAVVHVPWRRRAVALGVTALAIALAYATHQTGMSLGLGFVLLAGAAAARQGVPFSVGRLLLGVGPLMLAALVLAMCATSIARFGEVDFARELGVSFEQAGSGHAAVTSAWLDFARALGTLGVLPVVAAWGLVVWRPRGWTLAALLGFVAVPWLAFLVWGVLEDGGYLLAALPVLAVAASRASRVSPRALAAGGAVLANTWAAWASMGGMHGRPARPSAGVGLVALLAIAGQGVLALRHRAAFDDGFTLASRTGLLRTALAPDGGEPRGTVVALVSYAPRATLWFPRVAEEAASQMLAMAGLRGATPDDARRATAALEVLLPSGPVVFDATFLNDERAAASPFAPYLDAAAEGVLETFEVTRFHRGRWLLWRVERRR